MPASNARDAANTDAEQRTPPPDKPHRVRQVNQQDLAITGWSSALSIVVVAFCVILSVTGLWIYVAPFSTASQIQVLLHIVVGLLILIPYAVYQVRHFLVWYRQSFTAAMFLGYALMVTMLLCVISGLVLTWQSIVGPKLTASWDLVHLVTGIAVFALIVAHPLVALLRRYRSIRQSPEFRHALARFSGQNLAWLGGAAVIVVAAAILGRPRPVEFPLPEGYTLPSYMQEFDEYRGSPFAPTYARTKSGRLVDPQVLSHSASCGTAGCHEQILKEWQPSAHRFSAMNPPFQKVQRNFAADRDPAETRYCAGCHDPISLFAGAKDIHNLELAAPGMQEGVSCVVCHTISSVDQRGNADYVLTPPQKYIWENAGGSRKFVSDVLIRAYPRQHLADYDRNLLRTPEFCGACHKQFIPEALNRFGFSPGQNQYDEWRKSHWHTDDPNTDLSCRDCHMKLVYDSSDPGRGEDGDVRRSLNDEAHRHHGHIAANLLMPEVLKLPNWQTQVQLTREWLQGKTEIPEIKDVWPQGPVAELTISSPRETGRGREVALTVLLKSRKIGHNLTTGPLDFIRNWIHLQVTDADGASIAEWGNIDPVTRAICDVPGQPHKIGNSRDEGTLVLEGQPLDEQGKPLVEHQLWRKAGGKGQRVIFPRYTDRQTYRFTVPAAARGPITVKADLNYRRYRQEFLDLVVPEMEEESRVYQPVVTQHSAQRQILLTSASSGALPSRHPTGTSP